MPKGFVALEVGAWILTLLCGATLVVVKVQAGAAEKASLNIRSVDGTHALYASDALKANHQGVAAALKSNMPAVQVMGRLEIRSIGLSVPVLEGFDPAELRRGVGHIRGTAMPGGLGNMALAGHRDTFFRPLRYIRRGMAVSVITTQGDFNYVVDTTIIVRPEDVSVLAINDAPEMTLITCYPFNYVGAAPYRFIVRAHLKSIEPQ